MIASGVATSAGLAIGGATGVWVNAAAAKKSAGSASGTILSRSSDRRTVASVSPAARHRGWRTIARRSKHHSNESYCSRGDRPEFAEIRGICDDHTPNLIVARWTRLRSVFARVEFLRSTAHKCNGENAYTVFSSDTLAWTASHRLTDRFRVAPRGAGKHDLRAQLRS